MADEVPSSGPSGVTQHNGVEAVVEDNLRTPRTNFTDLPNEIIVQILGEVRDDEDLFQLAFLSRRVNHLALSVYLSRRSFGPGPNERLVLYDYNSFDVLRALNAAVFKSPLNRLQYPFSCRKSVGRLKHELQGLRRIIDNKLSSLGKVTIDLKNSATILPEPLLLAQNPSLNSGNPRPSMIPGEVLGDFMSLLNSIVARGCEFFEFAHSGPQTTAVYDINVAITEQFGGTRALSKTWGLNAILSLSPLLITRGRSTTTITKAKNSLKTFYLHSPITFHPHIGRWAIDLVNDSALDVLSISQQRSVHPSSWALVLSCISVPTLTNLTLDSCSMRLQDLLKFLMRHTSLQKLNFGQAFVLSDADARRRVASSPRGPQIHLSHFSTSLDLFIKLFDHAPYLFSSSPLHCFTILLTIPHGMCFNLNMIDEPLKAHILRLQLIKEVRFALSFGGVPFTWVVASLRADDENSAHTCITHLDIHLKVYSLSFSLMMKLRELLVRFPSLTHLTIITLAGFKFLTAFQKTVFIEMVHESCSKLDSVCFL